MLTFMTARSGMCFFSDANLTRNTTDRSATEEFDIRFASGSAANVFGALNINTAAVGSCIGALIVSGNNFAVLEQAYDNNQATVTYNHTHVSSVPVPVDTWVRVRFDYDVSAGHLKVFLDGGAVLDEAFQMACPYPNPDSITFRLGEMCVDNPAPQQIWYDDVTFDSP
jgi:hypothetical protein